VRVVFGGLIVLVVAGAYLRYGVRLFRDETARKLAILRQHEGEWVVLGLQDMGSGAIGEHDGFLRVGDSDVVLEDKGNRRLVPPGQIRWVRLAKGPTTEFPPTKHSTR
jgi:hypothetical protein